MRNEINPQRCKITIFGERVTSWQCTRKPVRDGYCAQHHPSAQAKRRAASDARYEAEAVATRAKWDARAERDRRADQYPFMLIAMEDALSALKDGAIDGARDYLERGIRKAKQ